MEQNGAVGLHIIRRLSEAACQSGHASPVSSQSAGITWQQLRAARCQRGAKTLLSPSHFVLLPPPDDGNEEAGRWTERARQRADDFLQQREGSPSVLTSPAQQLPPAFSVGG